MFESLTRLRLRLSLDVGHRLIQPRQDDHYICAFPRSGSTWVRNVLTNLMQPETVKEDPFLFNDVIIGVSIRNSFRINTLPSPRLLSSHTWYRPTLPKVLYILRDGRDVLVSFYHYTITRRGLDTSFPEFFNRYWAGAYGQRWDENVESWLVDGKSSMGDSLKIVRFEDLKAHTTSMFHDIGDFLGIAIPDDESLREAINLASLESRRAIESQYESQYAREENTRFYRGGKTGQWRDYMDNVKEDRFNSISANALRLGGYT